MYAASDFSFPQARIVSPEALQGQECNDPYLALLTVDRLAEPLLQALAAHLGPRLVLQEFWQDLFPQCGVLISSALSGGTLAQRLQEAPQGRSWLLLEPMAMDFPLPCPTGCGTPAEAPGPEPSFFSAALQCQYAHYVKKDQGHMLLWDTEETLQGKLAMAKELGFCGFAAATTV